jgi:hypothetical protein
MAIFFFGWLTLGAWSLGTCGVFEKMNKLNFGRSAAAFINDTYDFKSQSRGFSSPAVGVVNYAAYLGQQSGVISTYPININFDYKYNPQSR